MPDGGHEYPVFVTKKALKEGLRFHVMRLVPQKRGVKQIKIDPADQEHFPRPVTLQRRDPRQPPPGHKEKEEEEEPVEQPTVNSEEAERQAQLKAQRDAQRALDDAQKAPVLRDAERKRLQQKNKDEKKTGTQIHYQARTEKQKKEAEIRYEEALPWHLEDADGKQIWVGQYEAPLSDLKVALVPYPETGGYRMLPLEKWYKFTPKRGAFQHLTIEEAEKLMGKKAAPTRWAIRDTDRSKAANAREESRRIMYGPAAVKQESSTFLQASRREKMEHDDIDMSGDEFQDDDETAGFEPERDEDSKDSKDRVRREQLGANLFGDADEKQVEKEEAELQKEEEVRKLFGKGLKKALRKRDKQFQYDSDSSGRDPFASSSVSHPSRHHLTFETNFSMTRASQALIPRRRTRRTKQTKIRTVLVHPPRDQVHRRARKPPLTLPRKANLSNDLVPHWARIRAALSQLETRRRKNLVGLLTRSPAAVVPLLCPADSLRAEPDLLATERPRLVRCQTGQGARLSDAHIWAPVPRVHLRDLEPAVPGRLLLVPGRLRSP